MPRDRFGRETNSRRPAPSSFGSGNREYRDEILDAIESGRPQNEPETPKKVIPPYVVPEPKVVSPPQIVTPKPSILSAAQAPKLVSAYTSRCALHQHPDTLVMHCCDGRFDVPTWEFLEHVEQEKGIAGFESIVTPGGPATMLLNFGGNFFTIEAYVKGRYKKRLFKRVIGIAHNDCGAYLQKYPRLTLEERNAKAIADLLLYRDAILKIAKHLDVVPVVELYFAKPSDEQVEFLQLK